MKSFGVFILFSVLCVGDLFPEVLGDINRNSLKSSSIRKRSPTVIDSKAAPSQFKAYWNIPSIECKNRGVLFTDIYKNYGITQNANDQFRGEKFAIMYDPGNFPALIQDTKKGSYEFRNGGIPQEGNLELHLKMFNEDVARQIPDERFDGVAVIDFESWRPVFRQNFGTLQPYKDESYKLERKRHPLWSNNSIEKQAAKNFEAAGRKFVEETMLLAKRLRPFATWGYYAFPYCFNMNPNSRIQECSDLVVQENNNIQWMFDTSDILLPSVYFNGKKLNGQERQQMVKGRTNEAKRIQSRASGDKAIMLYFWFKYQDDSDNFITKEDVYDTIEYMYKQGLDAVILWGSSNDVNTKEKCLKLREFVDDTLGPVIKEFTQTLRTGDKEEVSRDNNSYHYDAVDSEERSLNQSSSNGDNRESNDIGFVKSSENKIVRDSSIKTLVNMREAIGNNSNERDISKTVGIASEPRADSIKDNTEDTIVSETVNIRNNKVSILENTPIIDSNRTRKVEFQLNRMNALNGVKYRNRKEIGVHKSDSENNSNTNKTVMNNKTINEENSNRTINNEKKVDKAKNETTKNDTVIENSDSLFEALLMRTRFFGYNGSYLRMLHKRK